MTRWIALMTALAGLAIGQTESRQPSFDAASVKVSGPRGTGTPPGMGGGPGTNDTGRITFGRTTLNQLLVLAYDLQPDQISGPGWISDFAAPNMYDIVYDIIATMPPDTTKERFHLMLQGLLVERFQIKLHYETRNFPGYELTVAPGGPKLKETTRQDPSPAANAAPALPAKPKINADGSFDFPPGPRLGVREGKGTERAQFQAQPMAFLAERLGNMVSRALGADLNAAQPRVTDKTGLTGKYDFVLEFNCQGCLGLSAAIRANLPLLAGRGDETPPAETPADPGSGLPNIFNALEKQLGLKLVKVKDVPVDVLVIDHVEKTPTEN